MQTRQNTTNTTK